MAESVWTFIAFVEFVVVVILSALRTSFPRELGNVSESGLKSRETNDSREV